MFSFCYREELDEKALRKDATNSFRRLVESDYEDPDVRGGLIQLSFSGIDLMSRGISFKGSRTLIEKVANRELEELLEVMMATQANPENLDELFKYTNPDNRDNCINCIVDARILLLLFEKGINLTALDREGNSPLDFAIDWKKIDVMKLLIICGVENTRSQASGLDYILEIKRFVEEERVLVLNELARRVFYGIDLETERVLNSLLPDPLGESISCKRIQDPLMPRSLRDIPHPRLSELFEDEAREIVRDKHSVLAILPKILEKKGINIDENVSSRVSSFADRETQRKIKGALCQLMIKK